MYNYKKIIEAQRQQNNDQRSRTPNHKLDLLAQITKYKPLQFERAYFVHFEINLSNFLWLWM